MAERQQTREDAGTGCGEGGYYMKILVMSDTHGWDYNAKKAVEKEQPFDVLIHLGDVQETETEFLRYSGVGFDTPAYFVEGNCDRTGIYPESQIVELAGHRLFLTHGNRFYVTFGTEELRDEAARNQCDIAIYGHTHRPELEDGDVLVLNPGSMTSPRQEGGQPSYMVMELLSGKEPRVSLKYI